MTSTARSLVPRALKSLAACVLLLVALALWSGLHARTCLALGLPALCCLAASYGIFTYRLARKRFALEYWLDPGSSLHAWFTRHWMTAIASLVLGVSLTGFLAIFTALARPTDWYFFCAIAIVTPLVFTAARVWPGRHFRQTGGARHTALADILTARLSGWVVFAVAAAGYTYANYYLPGPGELIFRGSLERTLDAFATQAGSACSGRRRHVAHRRGDRRAVLVRGHDRSIAAGHEPGTDATGVDWLFPEQRRRFRRLHPRPRGRAPPGLPNGDASIPNRAASMTALGAMRAADRFCQR